MTFDFPSSPALVARMKAIQQAASDTGRASNRVKGDLRKIATDDHIDKMLRGVTNRGQPRAPLAPSTLANPRRGPGPSLIPRGMASRYITTFRTDWVTNSDAIRVLRMFYEDFISKRGFNIPEAHETGKGRVPARPTAGITPRGWAQVAGRHEQYARAVLDGD